MTSFGNRMSIPTNFDKLLLIKLIRQRPALWDRTMDSYKNKILKTVSWHEICRIMKKDYDKLSGTERQKFYRWIIKIWTHTRDSWIRSLNTRKNAKKTGSMVRPYKYHKEMLFLRKIKGPSRLLVEESEDTEEEGKEEDETMEDSETDSIAVCENDWNVDSKEDIDLTIINQDNTTNEIDDTAKRQDSYTSEDLIHAKMTAFLNRMNQMRNPSDTQEDRHLLFFKSIHPSLTLLDDDQTLEFQSGVLNLLRNIKSGSRFNNVTNDQPGSSVIRGYCCQPELLNISQQPVVAPKVIQISSSSAGSSRTQPRIVLDPLKTD